MVTTKALTKFQLAKRDRDLKIKLYYQALPPGMRSIRDIARVFSVSKSTAHYAVVGRGNKKRKEAVYVPS